MDEVLHANVFFVIASIASVIFCIMTSLILYQVFKLVKALRRIVERMEIASEQVSNDFAHVRQFVTQGSVFSKMIGIIMGAVAGGQRRRESGK